MKHLKKFALLLVMPTVLLLAGCGGGGAGSPGDENDPAATSDLEQMEDETGEV